MKTFRTVYGIGLAILLPFGAAAQAAPPSKRHATHHHKHPAKAAASHAKKAGSGHAGKAHTAHRTRHSGTVAKHGTKHGTKHGSSHSPSHGAAPARSHTASKHHARKVAAAAGGVAAAGAAAAVTADAASAAGSSAATPQTAVPQVQDKGTNTGLPLPRFAAMRADKVYMRKGPGQRYPIEWVYHRRGLPVEIEREFDVWRLVEDSDGMKGWVHQATLVGQRTFVIPGQPPEGHAAALGEASAKSGDVIGKADARVLGYVPNQAEARARQGDVLLYSQADESSAVVAILQPGTVGTLKLCPEGSTWCRVVVKGYTGWLPRRVFWGLLPGETLQPS
ncbi:SH3 domain-containing protein [Swaminathania salitolerans]|uniref:SH3b domain-containing protein n=1 Tax=Swaminathania salitolerans TaxID=182838 RepID=A0A511BSI2_9PROT|nr:SH3 domain-containing protein [Swaminathania salitolerans]GBQ13343.1 hypothetical protein AA21291_1476 [Swaminathania salitolerans LMG 21291]GEL03289.1 hypothetical protein SSA02_24520 [Swaminathania salitolerans]